MSGSTAAFDGRVAIIDRSDADPDGSPPGHGLTELVDALEARGAAVERPDHWTETDADPVLVVGPADDPVVRKLLGEDLAEPETVAYRWAETDTGTALVASGTDDRGLMYALLELTDRVDAHGLEALDEVEDGVETPDNEVRGVDRFITGPVQDEWLYDEGFWHFYLARLARNRFNRFVLIVGYDSAFMSPPYPFVVDVPGYDDVRVPDDQVAVDRKEHRELLSRIGELCDRYGLDFFFGIWQQSPDWKEDQGRVVRGLPEDQDEFADYCATGLERLLVEIPEIDGLQLRVNWESGVSVGEMADYGDDRSRATAEAFWREIIAAVDRAANERDEPLAFDLRAKGLTDEMIRWAVETGLDVSVPTKFWCESTGLPYHNVRMRSSELANVEDPNKSRRYSFADLLEKPRFYDVLYRLWVVGTNRIFVWGDPDYARRFSHAAEFGDAAGFEVTAPLSLKGGHFHLQDEWWSLFDDPELRDYEWEDERYWAWYLFFGRLGYSRETDPGVWEREFESRFGEAADAVRDGYRSASKILPLITAAHLTRHPALSNWAELDTGAALFPDNNSNPGFERARVTYATAEPSDPGLFYGIDEYVRDALADDLDDRYTPLQVRAWLERLAAETREAVEAAEESAPDTGEFAATALDLRMLADLAEYHAEKTEAAIALMYYDETDDPAYLAASHGATTAARDAWASLAERGEGTYHDDLVFGMGASRGDAGQWVDRLPELDDDLEDLEALMGSAGVETDDAAPDELPGLAGSGIPSFTLPSFGLDVPGTVPPGEPIEVEVETGELNPHGGLTLHYRHTDQTEGAFREVEMERTDRGYRAAIPGDYVTEKWDLQLYVSARDEAGNALFVPGIYHAEEPLPYYVVDVTG